jgi:hypothetical protein
MTVSTAADRHTADLARIAEEAYLYLYPAVTMDVTRRVAVNVPAGARPGFGPMNRFSHLRAFPPGDFKEVVRPNFDTLYSLVWFDLRDDPVVVSVPDTGGRYYMLPMLDMWTDVFAVVGSRTTGTEAGHYALVRQGWAGRLPRGVGRIDAPTPLGWIVGRTQTNGAADYRAVNAIQDGFVATPLSAWPGEAEAIESTVDPQVDMATAPLVQVDSMSGADFIAYGAELMRLHPPHVVDQPILARLARLGLQPGRPFSTTDSGADVLAAIEQAPAAAQRRMTDAVSRLSPVVNGWAMPTFGMGTYGTGYLRRAVVARVGLGANLVEDAVYPVAYFDDSGDVPNGDHDYVLHFDAGSLPPGDAFWSVTMYDADGFTVPNVIERYAIGDRDPLRFNGDGSLDLYLQHDDPGDERRDNWLPAPRGPLGVTLRIYSPRPEALDGTWAPPRLMRA